MKWLPFPRSQIIFTLRLDFYSPYDIINNEMRKTPEIIRKDMHEEDLKAGTKRKPRIE